MKKMYCLVVTDYFSRFSWVFFLATKDETSEILKTFITGIENLIDLKKFSIARTPQQNGVVERKNRTLIEAAKTMLADSKLPTTFWAEAVNTACYVQNRVLVIKPHNKPPYELFLGRKPALSFMKPFGCPVTIFNTIDHLGKFDEKADEGFFVRYSTNSKAFRIFNSRTRIVEENLHVQFSRNTPNIAGSGPNWLFDIDALTMSMNYKPIVVENQSNGSAGTKACDNAGEVEKKDAEEPGKEGGNPSKKGERVNQEQDANVNNTNNINTVSPNVNAASIEDNVVDENIVYGCADDLNIHALEEIVYSDNTEDVGEEADMNNLDTFIPVSPIPATRVHKDHPFKQVIRDLQSSTLTRRMHIIWKNMVCNPSIKDPSWIEAMQEELLQFKLQQVWTLVDLPHGKRAIGTKWVYKNKKDERCIVIRNKARLVAQGHTEENKAKMDCSRMDVKSDFLYGKIEEEVYVCQPLGFEDLDFLDRTTSTPMETQKPLLKDADGEDVDEHLYRSMIGSLMYLNSSRPDIMFAQIVVANSITKAEYIAASNCCGQFWSTAKIKTINNETKIHAKVEGKIIVISESSVRRDLQFDDED
ncbi:putative ribonuclease H-like domain-containing protein, partial [Tanacetum coccineum]